MRKDIGELLTNEELSRIVENSMQELFFQRRKNPEYLKYVGDPWTARNLGVPRMNNRGFGTASVPLNLRFR
ncbi:MAG: hypothetical protein HC888_11875 [Candidatus Competibacteraceae bacterium]|nr:hypothetical protein [Candidatus Competibacteraceae bacterium]